MQPFPVIGTTFHGWTLDRVGRDRADVVLLVHLRKGNDLDLGAVSFDLTMRKLHGRWLVDAAVVAATFADHGKILAANDFGANSSPDPYTKVKGGLHSGLPTGLIYAIPGGVARARRPGPARDPAAPPPPRPGPGFGRPPRARV